MTGLPKPHREDAALHHRKVWELGERLMLSRPFSSPEELLGELLMENAQLKQTVSDLGWRVNPESMGK